MLLQFPQDNRFQQSAALPPTAGKKYRWLGIESSFQTFAPARQAVRGRGRERSAAGEDHARDQPTQKGCGTINVVNHRAPYSFHASGLYTLMGDGSVRWLAETIGPREMVALLTRAGGEGGSLK
jgi:hypothetical protein